MELIKQYFPNLSSKQITQLEAFAEEIKVWNEKINLVSRKNISALETQHILPSLAIGKIINFLPKARILDVGTGGGFPGIPLAILCPHTQFILVDSIQKKIQVVQAIVEKLKLPNVIAITQRAEKLSSHYGRFDFIVGRAVTRLPAFIEWVHSRVHRQDQHALKNGILYLKGGDMKSDIDHFQLNPDQHIYPLENYFPELIEQEKVILHIPMTHL